MHIFFWKYASCTLKDCFSGSSHWGPTNEIISACKATVPLINICLLNPYSPFISSPPTPTPPPPIPPATSEDIIWFCSRALRCPRRFLMASKHTACWRFHWLECAPLTRRRITEISCMVGVRAHMQKRLDTGLNEGPRVFKVKLAKRSHLWGCLYPTHKSTKSKTQAIFI